MHEPTNSAPAHSAGEPAQTTLPVISLPHYIEDLTSTFPQRLGRSTAEFEWTTPSRYEEIELLRVLLIEMNVFDEEISELDTQKLVDGDTIINHRGIRVRVHHVGVRLVDDTDCEEERGIRFLLELRNRENRWMRIDCDDLIPIELSHGAAVTAVVQPSTDCLTLVHLCSLGAFKSLFADADLGDALWTPSLHLQTLATEGAENRWIRLYPEREPIFVDYDTVRPDPEQSFGALADFDGGTVRTSFSLMDDGFIEAHYTFTEDGV